MLSSPAWKQGRRSRSSPHVAAAGTGTAEPTRRILTGTRRDSTRYTESCWRTSSADCSSAGAKRLPITLTRTSRTTIRPTSSSRPDRSTPENTRARPWSSASVPSAGRASSSRRTSSGSARSAGLASHAPGAAEGSWETHHGVEQRNAREPHKLEVVGSIPTSVIHHSWRRRGTVNSPGPHPGDCRCESGRRHPR